MKLCEIARVPNKFIGPVIGVEVEVEGQNLPGPDELYRSNWKILHDGSLRGESAEYVFRHPEGATEAKKALEFLITQTQLKKTKLDFSERTSVHIHLNVMDMELQKLCNLVFLYYVFEDVFLRYCGESRYHNRFCLSIRNAEGVLDAVIKRLNPRYIFSFEQNAYKYASLNLASMKTHGSLEFRGMRGNLDKTVLFPWIDVIQNLYTTAHLYSNTKEIFEAAINDVDSLIDQVFQKHRKKFHFKGMKNEVAYNLSLCAELPEYLTVKEKEVIQKEEKVIPDPFKVDFDEVRGRQFFAQNFAVQPPPVPARRVVLDENFEGEERWYAVAVNPEF